MDADNEKDPGVSGPQNKSNLPDWLKDRVKTPTVPLKDIDTSYDEEIISGKGIEAVAKMGWTAYRERLTQLSYADIAEAQLAQADILRETENASAAPAWVLQNELAEAKNRAFALSQEFQEKYKKTADLPYWAKQEQNKKLWMFGRDVKLADDKKLTRIYFGLPTQQASDIFNSLVESCIESGVMQKVDLALNLESYPGQRFSGDVWADNSIIAYVPGEQPKIIEELLKSVQQAKQNNPKTWEFSNTIKAKIKRALASSFKIPLADDMSFAEMIGNHSYDSGPVGSIQRTVSGTWLPSTEQIVQDLKRFSPDTPVEIVPGRMGHMPALINK